MLTRFWPLCLMLLFACALACEGGARGQPLRLATTTSVHESGLLAALVPPYEARTGVAVEVHAVGSGKALELLRTGQADLAITHAPEDELSALASGDITTRTPVMRNDFVLVGPAEHASVVAGASSIVSAMRAVATSGHNFMSRGDDSGTHRREQTLWTLAGVPADRPFVLIAHAGMSATLEAAAHERAFALCDRATFIAKRGALDLAIVFQGGDEMKNIYSVLEPPAVDMARTHGFVEFLRSQTGRDLIGGFGVQAFGEPLFTPVE